MSSTSSPRLLRKTGSRPTCASGLPEQYQSRSCPPGPQPRRSYSVMVTSCQLVPVGQLDLAVGAADRQLPADVGLDRVRLLAGEDGVLVQRAPGARGEAGAVEEDAGAVDDLGLEGVVLASRSRPMSRVRPGVVLPLVRAELLDDLLDPLDVVVVGEVRAEGAAAVVGAVGVDALAAAAEDAGPARGQPGQVAPEPLRVRPGVGRVGELHPDAGGVERGLCHVGNPTSCRCPS